MNILPSVSETLYSRSKAQEIAHVNNVDERRDHDEGKHGRCWTYFAQAKNLSEYLSGAEDARYVVNVYDENFDLIGSL